VSTPTSPFAIRDYRFYWFARLLSTIAQMAMVIVIGWQVYDIARQTMDIQAAAFQLGLIGLVQFAPLFLLTLVSGWTADRIDRRYIARAVLALEMLCAAILFWATWTGIISLPILFGVAALLGVARAFAGPAFGALAPNLVPREILPKAIAMSSMAWQSGSIAGPAIGGLLYDITPHLPYAVSTVLFGISLVAVLILRTADTLKLFDMVFTMTRGGPGNATEFIAILIERTGNRQFDIGLASAQSVILLIITIILARLYIRMFYREAR